MDDAISSELEETDDATEAAEAEARKKDAEEADERSGRMDKRRFIREMAETAELPLNVTERAYDAFIATLLSAARAGLRVNLTGFGSFEWRARKGHPVHFGSKPGAAIEDYSVLKFQASRQSAGFLSRDPDEVEGMRVPGTRRVIARSLPDHEG